MLQASAHAVDQIGRRLTSASPPAAPGVPWSV